MLCLIVSFCVSVIMLVQNYFFFFCLIQALQHDVNCYNQNHIHRLLLFDRFCDALFFKCLFESTQKNKMIRSDHFIFRVSNGSKLRLVRRTKHAKDQMQCKLLIQVKFNSQVPSPCSGSQV